MGVLRRSFLWIAILLAALLAIGCTSPGSTLTPPTPPTPTSTPTTTPTPTTPTTSTNAPTTTPTLPPTLPPVIEVSSPAQAAALVFSSEPRFARMAPLRADLIGQSAWYEAFDTGAGFSVAVTIGTGDCPAGCIDRHTWTYAVGYDGTIGLVGEEGDEVDIPPADGTTDPLTVNISLTAGPICPVEQIAPDPNCAPRQVVNAEVVLRDPSGAEVARATSAQDGSVVFKVPPGAYYVEPAQIQELMGTPEAQAFAGVGGDTVGLVFGYDTGIR